MKNSPTQRTLKELRDHYAPSAVETTEHWNPWSKTRRDLFGFCDVLAIVGTTTMAVQTTSASNHAARVAKLQAEPRVRAVLQAGWLVQVWSWRKPAKARSWVCRKEEITLEDLP